MTAATTIEKKGLQGTKMEFLSWEHALRNHHSYQLTIRRAHIYRRHAVRPIEKRRNCRKHPSGNDH